MAYHRLSPPRKPFTLDPRINPIRNNRGIKPQLAFVPFRYQPLTPQTYDPTIEDAYRKSTKISDQRCFIEIIDTAGQGEQNLSPQSHVLRFKQL